MLRRWECLVPDTGLPPMRSVGLNLEGQTTRPDRKSAPFSRRNPGESSFHRFPESLQRHRFYRIRLRVSFHSYIRSSPQAGYEALGNVLRIFPIAWQFRREHAIF